MKLQNRRVTMTRTFPPTMFNNYTRGYTSVVALPVVVRMADNDQYQQCASTLRKQTSVRGYTVRIV